MTQIRPAATKVTPRPLRAGPGKQAAEIESMGATVSSAPKVGRLGDLKWCSRCKAHLRRGKWHVVEIKNPAKEGHADEFTYDQRKFRAEVFACGGKLLTWRTKDDVFRDSNARISA